MGNLVKAAAAEHPEKSVLVLCGHTHSPGNYRDGNILVLTGGQEMKRVGRLEVELLTSYAYMVL